MTYKTGAAARSRFDPTSSDADNVDRILLAVCAAIWLAVLGSAVAAAVALVDLGSKHQESSTESGTPWLLYGVIGVSALIIVGAIPLLIRARRSAIDDPRGGQGGGARPATARTQTAGRTADTAHPEHPHCCAVVGVRRPSARCAPVDLGSQHVRRRATARGGPGVAAVRRGHRVRHGGGAAGDRHRHLSDGGRP